MIVTYALYFDEYSLALPSEIDGPNTIHVRFGFCISYTTGIKQIVLTF